MRLLFLLLACLSAPLVTAQDLPEIPITAYPNFDGESFGYVSCISADRNNNIWIGTREQGLIVYWQEEERWQQIIPADTIRWITDLTIDSRNNKWIGTPESGLLLVDEKGNFIEQYPIYRPDSSRSHLVNTVVVDYDNIVWVGTADAGVWRYDGSGWEIYGDEGEFIYTQTITDIAVDRYNTKWIGTSQGLFSTVNANRWDFYDVFEEIRDIYTDGEDNVLIAVLDRRRLEWVYCRSDDSMLSKGFLKASRKDFFTVKEIVIDKNKVTWATSSRGILRLELDEKGKGRWQTLNASNSAYTGDYATAMEVDITGRYAWVGTEGSGIFKIDLAIPEEEADLPLEPMLAALDFADEKANELLARREKVYQDSLLAVRQKEIQDSIILARAEATKDSLETAQQKAERDSIRAAESEALAKRRAEEKERKEAEAAAKEKTEKEEAVVIKKTVDIKGKTLSEGEAIQVENVNFAPLSAKLSDTRGLEEVYQFLIQNPNVTVELGGHTDRDPAESHPNYDKISRQNAQLSARRAQAVAEYLQKRGISPERVTTKGYGGSNPLFSYNTRKNRRVELKVIEIR